MTKGKPGTPASYLRSLMDTYLDAAVALVGCTSRGLERYSCEFDVLVVTGDRSPPISTKLGEAFADVAFVSDREVLKPTSPERSMSLAMAKPVRDTSLVLSTGSATASATLSDSAQAATRNRLTSALKTVARAEASLGKGAVIESDFWLMAASYELGYAALLSKEIIPSPSHLLAQLRSASQGSARTFEGLSIGAGLESAGRAGCGARLEGLTILHDLLREGSKSVTSESEWSTTRTEILVGKARELMTRVELAECYSFLGQELVDAILSLLKTKPKASLTDLATGGDRLIGERLVRQLGLARDEMSISAALEVVKREVTILTKKS